MTMVLRGIADENKGNEKPMIILGGLQHRALSVNPKDFYVLKDNVVREAVMDRSKEILV